MEQFVKREIILNKKNFHKIRNFHIKFSFIRLHSQFTL